MIRSLTRIDKVANWLGGAKIAKIAKIAKSAPPVWDVQKCENLANWAGGLNFNFLTKSIWVANITGAAVFEQSYIQYTTIPTPLPPDYLTTRFQS